MSRCREHTAEIVHFGRGGMRICAQVCPGPAHVSMLPSLLPGPARGAPPSNRNLPRQDPPPSVRPEQVAFSGPLA